MTEPQPGPMRGFVGNAMLAVGIIMVALCGTCTAYFVIGSLIDLAQGHSGGEFDSGSILVMAAMLGLPPIVVGALLVWGGSRLRRAPRPPPASPPPR
jgi:hypothetical protein